MKQIIISLTLSAFMNIESVITIASIIFTGLISAFSRAYVEAIFKEYPPNIRKHVSLIKKTLALILSYIFPIAGIIYLIAFADTVDKWFVLLACASVFLFFANIVFDSIRSLKKRQERMFGLHGDTATVLGLQQQNMSVQQSHMESIVKILQNHTKAIEALANKIT